MSSDDLQLVLVRYGSDTGLISLAARAILCHTVDNGDGGLEWPQGIPVVDFSEESRFTRLLGQDPGEPQHNWDDVLASYWTTWANWGWLTTPSPSSRIPA